MASIYLLLIYYRAALVKAMKDEWLREQQRLKRIALETRHDLPGPVQPKRVWRINGVRGRSEWAVPLLSGNIIAVVCMMSNEPRFPMTYRTQPPLQPLHYPQGAEGRPPWTTRFFCELYNDVFLTFDHESVLRAYCARTNTIQFEHVFIDVPVTDIEVVQTNVDEEAYYVVSDINGTLQLFRYRLDYVRFTVLFRVHSDEIIEVVAAGAKFAVSSVDGLVTVWDVLRREQIARIFNSRPVRIKIDSNHLVSYVDNVIRVYDAKCRFELKHIITLPKGPEPVMYPKLNLLSENLAVYHDDSGRILFFELATGNVVFHVRSPFRAVKCFKILKDLSIILSSEDETEGHAVISLPHNRVVHEALCVHVQYKYGEVMPSYEGRKWGRGIMFTVFTGALLRVVHCIIAARRHAGSGG